MKLFKKKYIIYLIFNMKNIIFILNFFSFCLKTYIKSSIFVNKSLINCKKIENNKILLI